MDKNIKRDNVMLLMELKKLGLNEKEAQLYLLILEKNEATATQLSYDSNISRPTAYRILDELEQKNLVNKIKKNKKTVFVATSPDTLLGLLKIKKREAQEQEREFLRIISTLQSTYSLKNSGGINEFDIKTSMSIFLDNLVHTPTDEIFALHTNPSLIDKDTLYIAYKKIHDRLPNLIVKELCQSDKSCIKKSPNFIQTKKIQLKQQDFSIIAANRIFIITKESIFTIDQKDTAIVIKSLLAILWNNL